MPNWNLVFAQAALFIAVASAGISESDALDDPNRLLYPRQLNWDPENSGSENVSLFVYRDINRNGRHDRGEMPLANVAVKMFRPDGVKIVRRSNRYGFVNFIKSSAISGVDIDVEGEYRFEVMPPPGWQVTDNNIVQKARFSAKQKTRAGIVADRVPKPVGLAPAPRISGRVVSRTGAQSFSPVFDAEIKAVGPSGEVLEAASLNESGEFSILVVPGAWSVRVRSTSFEGEIRREVRVEYFPVKLSAMVFGDKAPTSGSRRVVVDFDEITALPITKMPAYPEELEWTNLIVTDNQTYLGAGYSNSTVYGRYVGYSSSGYPVTVSRESPFDMVGAYFGVAWPQAEGETLTVRAWRDDELVAEERFLLSAMAPFWFDANFRDITLIEFATQHYWQFVMDRPTFEFP